jgi:hypothetical protein
MNAARPATGRVAYVGRSLSNVDRRAKQSQTDRGGPKRFKMQVVYRSNDPTKIKGAEQKALEKYRPGLNRIRAVGPRNPARVTIMESVRGLRLPRLPAGVGGGLNLTL